MTVENCKRLLAHYVKNDMVEPAVNMRMNLAKRGVKLGTKKQDGGDKGNEGN